MKSILQAVLGKPAWQYASWYRDQFGLIPAVGALGRSITSRKVVTAPNPLTGGFVYLRPGTADQSVYQDIFIDGEYDINFDGPSIIVDAGAHIGLGSVVFASKYPQARIIALEPEPSNFAILQKNAQLYPNIEPVQLGLWHKRTHLCIEDSTADTWSFRVKEDPSGSGIPAVDVLSLRDEYGLEHIDVLKIDIEGSEIEVLNHSAPWINHVGALIIELHDRFRPGCREALDQALQDFDFRRDQHGENIVFHQLHRSHRPASDAVPKDAKVF